MTEAATIRFLTYEMSGLGQSRDCGPGAIGGGESESPWVWGLLWVATVV